MIQPDTAAEYTVQLLCASPAAPLATDRLDTAVTARFAAATRLRDGEYRLDETGATARFTVVPGIAQAGDAEAALSQTWDWPAAGEALSGVRSTLQVAVTMPAESSRPQRLMRVHLALQAACDLAQPLALHWLPSQRMVDPQAWRESLQHGAPPADHAINVRLFRIADGRAGEGLMDTMGLTALGLPDLQCRFRGLDLGGMAQLLFAYAEYLYEKGDVLGDESLVRGLESYEEWECARGPALVEPQRPAVTFLPDAAHRVT